MRIEDCEFRPNKTRGFWFVSTDDQAGRDEDPTTNELGRLYRLRSTSVTR